MKLTGPTLKQISDHIADSADDLTTLIAVAVAKHAQFDRAATITQCFKVSRDTDDFGLVHISCQVKVSQPCHKFKDEKSWNESESIVSVRLGEDPGQKRIDE